MTDGQFGCRDAAAGFVQLVTKQLAAFVKIGGGSEEEEEAMAEVRCAFFSLDADWFVVDKMLSLVITAFGRPCGRHARRGQCHVCRCERGFRYACLL